MDDSCGDIREDKRRLLKDMDIGDVAEDLLTLWASETGINVVEPRRDRRGWDRMYEFPPREEDSIPVLLDRRPPELVCRLQSKATRGRRRRISVKLDNWERFAKSPLPCFFVIFEFGYGRELDAVFLVHVGEAWTEKTLHRLRQEAAAALSRTGTPLTHRGAGGKKRVRGLHQMNMSLTWNDDDRLPENSAEALAQAIRATVRNPKAYTQTKLDWIDTLGYDEQRAQIRFTTKADRDTNEQLADLALGLVDRVPVSSLVTHDLRFGIPLPHSADPPQDAFLTSVESNTVVESTVTIIASDSLRSITLGCETRASMSMFPFLPKEHWKIRCTTRFTSFLLRLEDGTTRCDVSTGPPTEQVELGEFADLAELVGILHQSAESDIEIKCELPLWQEPVTVASKGRSPQLDDGLVELCLTVERAAKIATDFGLDRSHRIVPANLFRQREQIAFIHGLVAQNPIVSVSIQSEDSPDPEAKVAALFASVVKIGDSVLTAFVAIPGMWKSKHTDDGVRMEISGRPEIVHRQVTPVADWNIWKTTTAKEVLERVAEKLERERNLDEVAILAQD